MKYTTPPEGHRFHNPDNAPEPPKGWRFCLEAEVRDDQNWFRKKVRCEAWDENKWTHMHWAGNTHDWTYIVPDTTPWDIPGFVDKPQEEEPPKEHSFMDELHSVAAATLTKRELFAAMAMHGMCRDWVDVDKDSNLIAEVSVNMADTLIAELNKKEEA